MNRKEVASICVLFIYRISSCGYIPKEKQFYLLQVRFSYNTFIETRKERTVLLKSQEHLAQPFRGVDRRIWGSHSGGYEQFSLIRHNASIHGGDMFLRNVSWLSTDYTALYPRRWNSEMRGLLFLEYFCRKSRFPFFKITDAFHIPKDGSTGFISLTLI
jgi:hypothetical protein